MEKIDIIPGTDFKIIQNRAGFSYGVDAIVLSEFARAKGVVVDLGTGTGIIPLRILGRQKIKKAYGIEIQEEVADMARRSVALNGLEDQLEILNMDLRELEDHFGKHTVDTVVSNPPYMDNKGLFNREENFTISRHEVKCTIGDIARASAYLLRPNGRLYLVHRPDRLVDIFYQLRKEGLEPKWIRFVRPRRDSLANLVLIEAVQHARPELRYHKDLIVYREEGIYTEEIEEIYGR